MFDAPIAGANYASDTKNYPWHRPPDIVSYDEGVDYMITKINEPESLELVFSLLKIDTKVATVVTSLLMQAISRGKYSIDLAILMAGPLARYIGIIADEQNIKFDMGVGDKDRIKITPTSLKLALGIVDDDEEPTAPDEVVEESTPMPEGGLMGAPTDTEMTAAASDDEQSEMLGLVEEVEEEETEDGLA
tara:strand:- start:1843 stop:2412 length:570 start_codon:yes stop_codon:yes gene_type:complete